MEETYTFSRALHMMRYGGKKMTPAGYTGEYYFFVKDGNLVYTRKQSKFTDFVDAIDAPTIMGSWVEVKDEA